MINLYIHIFFKDRRWGDGSGVEHQPPVIEHGYQATVGKGEDAEGERGSETVSEDVRFVAAPPAGSHRCQGKEIIDLVSV